MGDEGLVHKIDGVYKPTTLGVELLHNNFTDLRDFVDGGIKKLSIITQTAAIAGSDITKGDFIGLFMENGSLVAYSNRKSSSTGVALTSADRGREVGIGELEGIVKLKPGRIVIYNLPGMDEGGSKAAEQKKIASRLDSSAPDLVLVKGIIAEIAARDMGLHNFMKFAVVESAVDAASVGLNTVILTSSEHIPELKLELEKMNRERVNKIEYRITNY
jgi:putative transcriptional regulator